MGGFSEKIKRRVKEMANFRCCRCQNIGVEVHHIIPQKDGGSNDFDNAAPLCAKCHDDFGDNPRKRKEIKLMRDWWYKKCEETYKTVVILKDKPKPKKQKKEFPVVFFYHKDKGYLHWKWPNDFSTYYFGYAFAVQEIAKIDPEIYKKITNTKFRGNFFVHLIERLIFASLSLSYHSAWIFERTKWRFPWVTSIHYRMIDTSEIGSETINYLDIDKFKDNIFSEVNMDFGSFMIPKGTKVSIDRDTKFPKTTILMKNDYYKIQIDVYFSRWFYKMVAPEWLSGLNQEQQEQFATVTCSVILNAEPNANKLHDDKMGFYQKWVEDLCQELREQFDWLMILNNIKEGQIFEIRKILERSKTT